MSSKLEHKSRDQRSVAIDLTGMGSYAKPI
jgi:hypothetical protein